jgi:hypothetical protein
LRPRWRAQHRSCRCPAAASGQRVHETSPAPLKHSHFDFLSYISGPCCCLAFLCIPSVYHLSTQTDRQTWMLRATTALPQLMQYARCAVTQDRQGQDVIDQHVACRLTLAAYCLHMCSAKEDPCCWGCLMHCAGPVRGAEATTHKAALTSLNTTRSPGWAIACKDSSKRNSQA